MIPPPMSWRRVWSTIRAVQQGRVRTPGQWAALEKELRRMDANQRSRFMAEVAPYYPAPEVPA